MYQGDITFLIYLSFIDYFDRYQFCFTFYLTKFTTSCIAHENKLKKKKIVLRKFKGG